MKRWSVFVACVSALAVGCGEGLDTAPEEAAGEEMVTQTVLLLFPDGTYQQSTRTITRAEQQAQIEARAALVQQGAPRRGPGQQATATLSLDCTDSNALWLFKG